jgi:hypothetical protein
MGKLVALAAAVVILVLKLVVLRFPVKEMRGHQPHQVWLVLHM